MKAITVSLPDDYAAELRAKIRVAVEQVERGEFVDGEEFMDRLDRKIEERWAGRAKAP